MTSILTRRRSVIGLAVLTALLAGGAWWRAAWIVNQLLGSWAEATVAEKSGDVYRLDAGRVRFNLALRRVAVDSILVTTNRTLNALRPQPMAALRFAFHQCTISGVHLTTLILNGGLMSDSFGCRLVSVAVVVPPSDGIPDTVGQPRAARRAFLAVQQSLRLPSFAPRIRIARSDFPRVSLDFRLQRARGGDTRLQLGDLRWRIGGFATGFALSSPATTFTTSALVTGKVWAANYAVPTPANLTTAISNMQTAYTDAAGRTSPGYTELGAGNIQGMTLVPGLYKWGTGVSIPSAVTLSGGANDVWIFQIAQNLTVGNGAIVTLSGGAQAKNVFWQVAGQATLGTTSNFKGIILGKTLIAFNTGASITGRALAQTAVTLNATAVTQP